MLGIKETFCPVAGFSKKDIPIVVKIISGEPVEGRSVYGFFLTEEELDKIFLEILGFYTMPMREIKEGFLKKGKDIYMEELLNGFEVPVRKIKFWHRLGWSFKA